MVINFYWLNHEKIRNSYSCIEPRNHIILNGTPNFSPITGFSLCGIWRLATLPPSAPGVLWFFSKWTKLSCVKRTLTSRSLYVPIVSDYVSFNITFVYTVLSTFLICILSFLRKRNPHGMFTAEEALVLTQEKKNLRHFRWWAGLSAHTQKERFRILGN